MLPGPHFPTFISHGAAITHDKIFAKKHHYLNTTSEPGNITTRSHTNYLLYHLLYNNHWLLSITNTVSEPGSITTSDHISITFQLFTIPSIKEQPLAFKYHNADWDSFPKNISLKNTCK